MADPLEFNKVQNAKYLKVLVGLVFLKSFIFTFDEIILGLLVIDFDIAVVGFYCNFVIKSCS